MERAKNELSESDSVVTSDVGVRLRKMAKQIDLKNDNLPHELEHKLDDQNLRSSANEFDLSLNSSIDYRLAVNKGMDKTQSMKK